jgi:FkbM family methyltransferase
MIQRHHEHSFDLELMAPGETALDIGCRGFAIPTLLLSRGLKVLAVDADPGVPAMDLGIDLTYVNAAVLDMETAANRKITTLYKHATDQQAHTTVRPLNGASVKVPTTCLRDLRDRAKVLQFALLKLDCEGAEYGLMHDVAWHAAQGQPIARQVSVEYHDHCGLHPEPDMERWYARLHERLAPYYDVAKHTRERPPWGGAPHYVDSLYILRREHWR